MRQSGASSTRGKARLIGAAAAALLGLFVVGFVVFYVELVHPDDARVAPVEARTEVPFAGTRPRLGSLLKSSWGREWDVSPETAADARKALAAVAPIGTILQSARFSLEQQVFVPVGRYPARLDARDGVFVPAGSTLTLRPGLTGSVEFRLGLWSPDATAAMDVLVDGKGPAERLAYQEAAGASPPDSRSLWYRAVGRWFDVDPDRSVPQWVDRRLTLELNAGSEVKLSCRGLSAPALGCVVSDPTAYGPSQPLPDNDAGNFLVIMIDTMRGDAIEGGHAPRLSALAAESVAFPLAVSAGNMTSPSTNAFLSCRKATAMGKVAFAYTLSPENRESWYGTHQPSFPARFASAGYDTAMVGNVSVVSEVYGVGVNHGFYRQVAIETDGYDTAQTSREAVRWLRANGEHPFFLYVHFNGPHAPYRAPWRDLRATWPGPRALDSYADFLRWLYQSEISYTDRYVGQLLDELAALGLDRRTTVVVSADHGDQHQSRKFVGNSIGKDFSGAFFDHGATLYNDEVHVPLFIRRPGASPRQVEDTFVSALDVGPTLLQMAGVEGREFCAGVSLAGVIAGDDPATVKDRVIGSEAFQGRAVILENRWKYIRTYEATDKRVYPPKGWTGRRRQFLVPEQLFDLENDRSEERNLAASEGEVLARARLAFAQYYGVRERFELVVEPAGKARFEVKMAPGTLPRILVGDARGEEDATSIVGRGPRRVVIALDPLSGEQVALPRVVQFDGRPFPILMTGMRLPLTADASSLPLEDSGEGSLLAKPRRSVAYVRRVEEDGREDRRIVVGNPAFDAVLRQWGYLNDN